MEIQCLQIELTNVCNYNCIKCPRTPELLTREKGFMEIKLLSKILKIAKKYDCFINFSFFGEPLLHKEIFEILEMSKDFNVVMNSNISMLTSDIMDKLIEVKLNQLRVSIDAYTNKTYDIIRPSKFVKDLDGNIVKENCLDTIIKKIKYWHTLRDHPPTRHVFPVSSSNYLEVEGYVKEWQFWLAPKDEILIKSILSYGGKIHDDMITENPCNVWDQGVITISWDGNVTPCNLDTNFDMLIGNINNQSIEDILNGHLYKKIKNLSLKKNSNLPCSTCIDSNNWSKNMKITKNKKFNYEEFKSIYQR